MARCVALCRGGNAEGGWDAFSFRILAVSADSSCGVAFEDSGSGFLRCCCGESLGAFGRGGRGGRGEPCCGGVEEGSMCGDAGEEEGGEV